MIITTSFSVCFYSVSLDDVCVCIERGNLLIYNIPGLILIMLMMCILVCYLTLVRYVRIHSNYKLSLLVNQTLFCFLLSLYVPLTILWNISL